MNGEFDVYGKAILAGEPKAVLDCLTFATQ
jgi:hypothetical protein